MISACAGSEAIKQVVIAGTGTVVGRFAGEVLAGSVLRGKLGRIKKAPLPKGAPGWE
jgi:hypothetical protein